MQVLVAASRGSKLSLASPFSSQAEAGNVSLLRGNWMGDFFDEAEAFPQAAHDDMVDAVCSAYDVASGSAWRQRAARNRVNVGVLAYLDRKTRDCPVCARPIFLPVDARYLVCQRCGYSADLSTGVAS